MSTKKIQSILSLIEVSENNLRNARAILSQLLQEKGSVSLTEGVIRATARSSEEQQSLDVVEGYFDGENVIGDNGQIYLVPQNYASKTQLVIGDRMKWILTEVPETGETREVFKLIQPVPRDRVVGTFSIEGANYVVLVDSLPNPVKILKASATYAMKNLGLKVGDEVAIYVPKDATATWGAFISVVHGADKKNTSEMAKVPHIEEKSQIDVLSEFKIDDIKDIESVGDYF